MVNIYISFNNWMINWEKLEPAGIQTQVSHMPGEPLPLDH